MLDVFRSQSLKNTVYGLMILAIVIVFVVQFRPGAGGRGGKGVKSECIAEVRGVCISRRDFRTAMILAAPRTDDALAQQLMQQLQISKQAFDLQVRKGVLDGLIERELLSRDAERLGLSVSDEDLNGELTSGHAMVSLGVEMPPRLLSMLPYASGLMGLAEGRPMRLFRVKGPNGKFDQKVYEKSLRTFFGRGPAEFREMQQAELLAARMRDVIRVRVRVADEEAFEMYRLEKSTVSLRYARFARPWFARHSLSTGKAVIDAWVEAHKDEVAKAWEAQKNQYLPECRRVRQIFVKIAETASDDEKVSARKKMDQARERIAKGASFDGVARDLTEEPSAAEGEERGELGCVGKGKLSKPLEDAVFSMKEGELSPVLETEKGLYVLRLEATYHNGDAETEGRRELARSLMIGRESEATAATAAKEVRAAVASGTAFEQAIKQVVEPLVVRPVPESKAPSKPDDERPHVEEKKDVSYGAMPIMGAAVDVVALAVALDKPGDVPADVIKLEDGYAVMQLLDKKTASRQDFEQERTKMTASLLAAKQHDALLSYVTRLREAAKGDIKIDPSDLVGPPQDSEPSEEP